jgi:hypothetical protein
VKVLEKIWDEVKPRKEVKAIGRIMKNTEMEKKLKGIGEGNRRTRGKTEEKGGKKEKKGGRRADCIRRRGGTE